MQPTHLNGRPILICAECCIYHDMESILGEQDDSHPWYVSARVQPQHCSNVPTEGLARVQENQRTCSDGRGMRSSTDTFSFGIAREGVLILLMLMLVKW